MGNISGVFVKECIYNMALEQNLIYIRLWKQLIRIRIYVYCQVATSSGHSYNYASKGVSQTTYHTGRRSRQDVWLEQAQDFYS